ncbi:MAG: ABC transporter permease [Pseudomonadota bacterium]
MSFLSDAIVSAVNLIVNLDRDLIEIISLSLKITLSATLFASVAGIILGSAIALYDFPGRNILTLLINTFMGFPPVVLGLFVYLLLSRSGPLGILGLLYTPTAMVIAQTLLILPIIIALTRQTIFEINKEYNEQLRSLGAEKFQIMKTLVWESRLTITTIILAGYGRANAEVGAVMIVGGNINHATRVMTTTIAHETGKGNLILALSLGIILILIAFLINFTMQKIESISEQE